MCGIAGWFDLEDRGEQAPDASQRAAALRALAARGPDGEGLFVNAQGSLGLLHRRLAIIDLEGGSQPMAGPEPGDVLAWNGELFDHERWRQDLERTGHAFRTRSDTEVMAGLLADRGVEGLRHVCAQYALAWCRGSDGSRPRELLLARDPAGEKPLFWARHGQRIVFASTLEALLHLAPIPRVLEREALSLYLSWGFVPAPLTVFEGVRKLEAGQWLRFVSGREMETGRTRVEVSVDRPSAGDEATALRAALASASRLRLHASDVPVGVFLSGGLDSLAITAVLRDEPGLQTFTVRGVDPACDESEDAARVAKALGVAHEVIDPPAADADRWHEVFARYGEPFGTTSALAVDAVARAAREHVKVVLTGDGGDEALGGYPRHVLLRRLARVPRLPGTSMRGLGRLRRLRRAAELMALDPADRYAAMYEVFGPWRARLTPRDDGAVARDRVRALWSGAPAADLAAMLRVDRALELPDSHCVKVDGACMGNGVEPRSPWLDPKVVALCDALPRDARIQGGRTKRVLRALIQAELPRDVARHLLGRPKRGFTVGFDEALRSDAARDLLLGGPLERVPGIEGGAVRAILDEHVRGSGNHGFRLAVLLGLAVFSNRWL